MLTTSAGTCCLPAFPDEVLDVTSLSAYQGSANTDIALNGQGFGYDPTALRVTFVGTPGIDLTIGRPKCRPSPARST